jgi:hypothetical protein
MITETFYKNGDFIIVTDQKSYDELENLCYDPNTNYYGLDEILEDIRQSLNIIICREEDENKYR